MSDLVAPLERKLLVLSETKRLDRISELVEGGHFQKALNEINDLNNEIRAASRACTALANVINKRHWSPLLVVQS